MNRWPKAAFGLFVGLVVLFRQHGALAVGTNRTQLSVDVVRGFPGAIAQVPISLRSTGQVVAAQFDITYPSASLSPGAITGGNLGSNYKVKWSQVSPGVLRYLIYSTQNLPFPTNISIGTLPVSVPSTETHGGSLVPGGIILAHPDASAAAPVFSSSGGVIVAPIFRATDGTLLLLFNVQSNQTYVVQATTNFVNWVNISTNFATLNYITVADNDAINMDYRFYRLFQPAVAPSWTIDNPAWQGGAIGFQVSGAAGSNFVIQASTNLVNWQNILTNAIIVGPVPVLDTNAGQYSTRFYRVLVSP